LLGIRVQRENVGELTGKWIGAETRALGVRGGEILEERCVTGWYVQWQGGEGFHREKENQIALRRLPDLRRPCYRMAGMQGGLAVRDDRPDLPIAFPGNEEMGAVRFAHK
jgi:hypothetical protein